MFYDPLGALQPILISLKALFQNLCKQKFESEESILDEFKSKWGDISSYLGNVRTIEIPRKVLNHFEGEPPQRVALHGFSNASQYRYGACIYLKSISKGDKVSVYLIASKSGQTPIKDTNFPFQD